MTAARSAGFAVLVGLTLLARWEPLTTLVRFSFQEEHYSHIILIPLVSAALVILERRRIFAHLESRRLAGGGLLGVAALLYLIGPRAAGAASANDRLSMAIAVVPIMLIGSFVLCYGLRPARAAAFPLFLLVFIVPVPDAVLSRVITWLQTASAEVSYVMFELLAVPVLRTGFVFALPGVTVEVAEECSGIRSSLAMVITSLVGGHLLLRSMWSRAGLVLATLPLLVVKNGIRIVTLSLLSVHVDPSFLTGSLHRQGGIVFFVLALLLLAPILWLLQKLERGRRLDASAHA
jgi:exosortase